jgi:hypothetical protein
MEEHQACKRAPTRLTINYVYENIFSGICCLVLLSSARADFDLDVDNDGKTEALTDGLLVIRYLFGFSGEALVVGAVASEASRNRPEDIGVFLKNNESKLDVDNNATVTALTDGLLVIRHLFGFSGDALTSGAISETLPEQMLRRLPLTLPLLLIPMMTTSTMPLMLLYQIQMNGQTATQMVLEIMRTPMMTTMGLPIVMNLQQAATL